MRAQDLSFVNYSTKEGMSSAQVYRIFQDINGDMLFTTDRGITKFDGYQFNVYSRAEGLTNTTVFNFFTQADGKIWCNTINNSWFYFENGTTEFKACEMNDLIQEQSNGGNVSAMWIDLQGNMHLGFQDISGQLTISLTEQTTIHPLQPPTNTPDTVYAFFVKTDVDRIFTYFSTNNETPDFLSESTLHVMSQSREKMGYKCAEFINEKFIFSSENYLQISDGHGPPIEIKFDNRVIGLGRYDDTHFWVGLNEGGLRIVEMNGKEAHHWLRNESATHFFRDKHNGIWISTLTHGVFYAQNEYIKCFESIGSTFVLSISPGKKDEPLISSFGHHYQIENRQLKPILVNENIFPAKVVFFNGQYHHKLSDSEILNSFYSLPSSAIVDFSENNDSSQVIASPFAIYIQEKDMFREYIHPSRITAIEIAEQGVLVGGYNGLSYISSEDGEAVEWDFQPVNARIKDIKRKGKYHYVATNEFGLVRYNEREKHHLQITPEHGLASNLINEIFAFTEDEIWVATDKGLDHIVFQGNEYTIEHFGIEDGLLDNDITDVYVHDGIVWIGTRSGLCSLELSDFQNKFPTRDLSMFLKYIKVNDHGLEQENNAEFSHNENNIEIEFHSAFYGGNGRVKYRYRLNDDDVWHELNSRTIRMYNLQSGRYNLTIQGNVDNSDWDQNQLSFSFTILPPFYRTWWFRAFIAGAFLGLFYLFLKLRVLIYNKSLVQEALRLIIRKLNPNLKSFVIQEHGITHRINSHDILFLNSDGNYLTIQLKERKHIIRFKIGEFEDLVPDKLEYIRVHKSFVVRIDKITSKNADHIFIDGFEIPIGKTYKSEISQLDAMIFDQN